jgi:hypothetical protein
MRADCIHSFLADDQNALPGAASAHLAKYPLGVSRHFPNALCLEQTSFRFRKRFAACNLWK